MSLALMLALSLMTANPGAPSAAYLRTQPSDQAQPAPVETEDVPPGAPTDDYGFVSWCYGATDE